MGQYIFLGFITLIWLFAMGWLWFVIRPAINSLQESTIDALTSIANVKLDMEELAKPVVPQEKEITEEERRELELQNRLRKLINAKLSTNPYERNRNRRNHG